MTRSFLDCGRVGYTIKEGYPIRRIMASVVETVDYAMTKILPMIVFHISGQSSGQPETLQYPSQYHPSLVKLSLKN